MGCHLPPPGNLPDPGTKPASPAMQAGSLSAEPSRKPLWIFSEAILQAGGTAREKTLRWKMSVTGVDGGRWRIGRDDAARVKGTQSTVGHGKDSGSCSE